MLIIFQAFAVVVLGINTSERRHTGTGQSKPKIMQIGLCYTATSINKVNIRKRIPWFILGRNMFGTGVYLIYTPEIQGV